MINELLYLKLLWPLVVVMYESILEKKQTGQSNFYFYFYIAFIYQSRYCLYGFYHTVQSLS